MSTSAPQIVRKGWTHRHSSFRHLFSTTSKHCEAPPRTLPRPTSRSKTLTSSRSRYRALPINYPTKPTRPYTSSFPSGSAAFPMVGSPATSRLSLLSKHLSPSTYSSSSTSSPRRNTSTTANSQSRSMSSQPEHPTLLIPGPIEFDDEVLQSMSHYSQSHVGAPFVQTFSETLKLLRKLFQTTNPASQPFVISGSGTLGWDQVAANLSEPGDEVLVLHTGYFADSFADCFETYGVKATQLKAPIGSRPQLPEIEAELKKKSYKLLTVTHVDTSTGVLSELKALSELVHRVSPDTLLIVDGVCSVGSEEIRFDDWNLDVVLTASQKGVGVPAGLSILMASGRAIEVFKARKTRPTSYFGSWANWLPIMQNYEAGKPSYFATPSPQLIHALHTSLTQILSRPLEKRFEEHRAASQKVKKAVEDFGLKQLAHTPADQANGMTAIYLPENIQASQILPVLLKKGIIFAGGLHKEIATKYFRFGHMGVSVTDPNRKDIDKAIEALKEAFTEAGYKKA